MECRICGGTHLSLYYTQGNKNEFKYYRCATCTNVNYDLSTGLDQEKYAARYFDPEDENARTNVGQTVSYNFIKNHVPVKGRFLDIGCGNGRILLLAKRDGFEAEGLELSEFYAEKLWNKAKIPVKVANFLELEIPEEMRYDVITLRHVLEHLPNPRLAMSKINELLNPEGFAELEFPHIEGYGSKLKRFKEKTGISKKKYPEGYKPGHCNEYTKKSFNMLAEVTGFEMIKWQTYSSSSAVSFFYKIFPIGSKVRVIIKKKNTNH